MRVRKCVVTKKEITMRKRTTYTGDEAKAIHQKAVDAQVKHNNEFELENENEKVNTRANPKI
jgi:hypothetical protein